jgi:hypothetical protein
MPRFVVQCPACQSELQATRLACSACQVQLEGVFELPSLLRLPATDLAFVTNFVRASGSLKAMAEREGTSYPTVRARLDAIIERLSALEEGHAARRHQILDALESGKISVAAAEAELRKAGL